MSKSNSIKMDGEILQLTPTEILCLLSDDNDYNNNNNMNDNEPLTGETMELLSHRMKANVRCIDVQEFMRMIQQRNKMIPICDARSPGEYAVGHVPGAINLPLFTNEERAIVGTLYTTKGRSQAMVAGMAMVRPKLDNLVSTAAAIVAKSQPNSGSDNNVLLLHCWRGGMRSCALAFLVQTRIPGLTVYVLKDGYKAFRRWQYNLYCYLPVNSSYSDSYDNDDPTITNRNRKKMTRKQRLKRAVREASASGIGIAKREAAIARVRAARNDSIDAVHADADADAVEQEKVEQQKAAEADWEMRFDRGPRIAIIGGPTGSGKTRVLHALRDVLGEQIIDLEGLANHSGSAFGFVGHDPQPTPQQYTNNVAMQWNSLDPERWVFIEDEGPNVGRVNLPVGLYRNMRTASAVFKLDIPKDIRVQVLRDDYALPETMARAEDSLSGKQTDQIVSEWLRNMIKATRTLEKRIGPVKVNSMIGMLQNGRYAEFSSAALEYYDDLYDKHIANEHGSANMKGKGERAATISTVRVRDMKRFDAEQVARQVLKSLSNLNL